MRSTEPTSKNSPRRRSRLRLSWVATAVATAGLQLAAAGTAAAQSLLIVNPGCTDTGSGIQAWPGWAVIDTTTSSQFLVSACSAAYDVVQIDCVDSNITSPAAVATIAALAQNGVSIFGYAPAGTDLSWVDWSVPFRTVAPTHSRSPAPG